MLAYMLATLVVCAFAGTVLLHPAFRSDLTAPESRPHRVEVDMAEVREFVAGISVVIPARNEERTLPTLLHGLTGQSMPPHEIVVVDDQSEDKTTEVASRFNVNVLPAGERPEGWLGKPWASMVGARAASGRFLLFLDADVSLAPDALEVVARAAMAHTPDWREQIPSISVQPYHRTVRATERLALLFNILVFVGSARRARGLRMTLNGSCCFGPCILCARDDYFAAGAHEGVRMSILDDLDLGLNLRAARIPSVSFTGRGVIDFRMYPGGFRALLEGFTKNILLGAKRATGWFKVLAVLWMTGLLAAPLYIVLVALLGNTPELVVAIVFYTFFAIQFAAAGQRLGNFGVLPALVFPVHIAVFLFALLRASFLAVSGRNVSWKGRVLHADRGT